ncbi:F-box domain containing protein [Beauveria bassiana ARSEF 2860]|uniref:F-box domain containing protein n=1 Tax=Beauveria bassiana (strain ARSEF 2860) TaxID=655819 RepID=J5JM25_BEAB2|nr:F-box domain containing protein [Beauveria bassiana ARSEF 2860]EJP66353.1 F-box domain containing protein [Beauveria bassiana ARSEF 2860]
MASSTSDTLLDTGGLEGWISLPSSVFSPNSVATLELSSAPMHSTTTTEMQVPPGPVIIGIAMVNTGIWDYITGIRIIRKADGQEQFAGFAFDSGEVLYSVAALHGFNVALGPHGVRALQIVGPQRDACSWIGRTEGVPISELLGVKKSVNRLRVTCDGYKITALSVYCDKTESTTSCEPEDTNLRHTAVWYPKVPSEDLVLNDGSFTGLRPVSTTYQPISWIKFGGQRGKNLPHVKGVMIKFDNASLSGLQFVYDCDVPETGNAASESFGRCGPSKMEGALLFSIDGAAGERITSISVGLAVYENPDYPEHLRHGIIQYLTMSTNFDRTTSLGKKKDGFRMKNVDVASGTTITGFYGHFAWGDGLINLGVISEYL